MTGRRGTVLALAETDRTGEVFAANRAQGEVRLTMAVRRGATVRSRIAEEGSLRVRFPGACAGAQEAVLVNTAGGIAGGDRLRIAVTLDSSWSHRGRGEGLPHRRTSGSGRDHGHARCRCAPLPRLWLN